MTDDNSTTHDDVETGGRKPDSGGATVAIFNPASGGAVDEERLRKLLGDDVDLVPTTEDDPGIGQARSAVDNGADTVIACGGDGTVRACLEGLVGGSASLAIIPTGTGNLLATNLGIDGDVAEPDGDAPVVTGRTTTLDVGRINGEAFAVMAGSGFDALMIRDANPEVKSRLGVVAYVLSAVRHLRSSMVHTTVVVDGQQWFSGRTVMALVGNFGSITGGVEIFPDADPSDGVLDVGVVAASGVLDWMKIGYRLVRALPQDPSQVRRTQGRSVEISTAAARPYELDGEERPATDHLEVTVETGALRVHVPAETET